MAKQLQLSIPTPCHKNWDDMTTADKGRFCDSCQKQVVDFSSMSDRQVSEFFKKPSEGSVCGRFMSDQLERDIEIPTKRIPWVKYFFQFALPAFLVSIKASTAKAQGEVRVKTLKTKVLPSINRTIEVGDVDILPVKKDTVANPPPPAIIRLGSVSKGVCVKPLIGDTVVSVINEPIKVIDTAGTISGIVIDEKGDPLPGASVRIKGTRIGVAADADGRFRIRAKSMDVLVVSGAGLESAEATVSSSKTISIVAKRIVSGMVSYSRTPKKTRKEIKNVPLLKQEFKDTAFSSFKVYPNPVSAGSGITIEAKKQEEGYYNFELLNQSGQKVHQQRLWIDAEARLLSIDVPNISTGSYFLVMTNSKTGKRFTEKIIVQ